MRASSIINPLLSSGSNQPPPPPPERPPQRSWEKLCLLLQGLAALVTLIGVGIEVYVYLAHALSN